MKLRYVILICSTAGLAVGTALGLFLISLPFLFTWVLDYGGF